MAFTPKITSNAVGIDEKLDFFDKLIKTHHERAIELGRPITFTGFKGSANIVTYDGEREEIPDTESVQEVKVNRYETRNEQYVIRVYPDGLCDHFEIRTIEGQIIESIPLLMKTHYKKDEDNDD